MKFTFHHFKQGVEKLDKSCDLQNANACFYLCGMYITGIHSDPNKNISDESTRNAGEKNFIIPKDISKAFKYATKACELGNMYACVNLSTMYARGEGTEKNAQMAEKYKNKAIELRGFRKTGS